ncbi:MAG: EamA-like transporter family protein [Sphingobacteriales bacterium 50-39]|nr:DMT family transporter [Sphingobacteriales bacterium]OJW55891.1 MAG: EamA-like transporter family protein [Sphingobacteriales bacterium 50-39]
MKKNNWLFYAAVTTISWGVWGALIELPEKSGFPATLGYVVWSLTMVPCALSALWISRVKLARDGRSVFYGLIVGLFGAGGQLLLFEALREGPAYIVFPIVSLFPILTVVLSMLFLRERGSVRQWAGIGVSLAAIFLLSYQPATGGRVRSIVWLLLAILVFILWGAQAFIMKFATQRMNEESIFFYMMAGALLLTPVALYMTSFSGAINVGFRGPWLAAMIHVLNSIGALTLVYALRYGKAIVVVPMTGLSPLITVGISLILYAVIPGPILLTGVGLAMAGIYLLSE